MDVHQANLWLPFITPGPRSLLEIYKLELLEYWLSYDSSTVLVVPISCLLKPHSLMRIAIDTKPSPDTDLQLPALSPSDPFQTSPDTGSPLSLFPTISHSFGHSLGILHRLRLTPLRPVTQTTTFSIPGDHTSPCSPQQDMATPSPSPKSTRGILFQPPTEEQHRDMIRLGFMSLPSSF